MSDLHPDHLALLALARRAFAAESGPLWKTDLEDACDRHATSCDALWEELRRQVDLQDGKVPVLEHPTVKARELAKRLRREIIATATAAIEQALSEMEFSG